jgi:alkanesulfonate monooxygenase
VTAPYGPLEIAWFSALCDDDYEFLGVPDPSLVSSVEHCGDIVRTVDRLGFDNILLPSGYSLGIDATAFAAAVAPSTSATKLLLAVRAAELWPPQLARDPPKCRDSALQSGGCAGPCPPGRPRHSGRLRPGARR